MRYVGLFVALMASMPAWSQVPAGFTITNYKLVGDERRVSTTVSEYDYRADVMNTGAARSALTASATSTATNIVVVQGLLRFSNVPANGQATSTNFVTLRIDRSLPFDIGSLQWTFSTPTAPTANAGPNQTVAALATVTLNGSASTTPPGTGPLTYSWAFVSRPIQSATTLANPSSVSPTFVADAPGTYVVRLTVSNQGASDSANVTISTGNSIPVANPGPNQSVGVTAQVQLDGSRSSDVNGDALTYAWTITSKPAGSNATLSNPLIVNPRFQVDRPGTYVIQLIVNDGKESSAPEFVTISTHNTPPVANAGPAQSATLNNVVQLTGAGSTDVDGDSLTYLWSLNSVPAGSTAILSSTTAVNPTFTLDKPGTYVAQLIVNDGTSPSVPATVTISTNAIQPPTANAGPDQSVRQGAFVTLSASGTDPQSQPLTYTWSFTTKPATSTATLNNPTSANPTFTADKPGLFVVQLIANNGYLNSAPVTVNITTIGSPPVADAGPNQNTTVGALVTLTGAASTDADNDPITYAWSFTSRPAGSNATLTGPTSVSPTFIADVLGTYVIQLIVNDGFNNSTPVTVTVVAVNRGNIVLPVSATVGLGATVAYPVTISSPAPAGGVTLTLTNSDPTRVSLSTSSVFIAEGATAPAVQPQISGPNLGSVTIGATGYAYTAASESARTVGSLSFTPPTMSFDDGANGTLTLTLSGPAPTGGLTVNLSSTNTGIATVPATVTFPQGATTANIVVTPGTPTGTSTIRASALPNLAETTALVTLNYQNIILPANVVVAPAEQVNFNISLANPAPGPLSVTLTVSDPAKASFTGNPVSFATGQTQPTVQPKLNGLAGGQITITATASGLNTAVTTAFVSGTNAGAILLPSTASISQGQTINYPVSLTAAAPNGGVTIDLSSNNTASLTITPATVTIPAGQMTSSVVPQITGGGTVGQATITATALGLTTVNRIIQVTLPQTPTANAGSNQTVRQNSLVTLNGSGTDPQSFTLTYLWTLTSKPGGSNANLSSTTIAHPTFTPDVPGTYTAQLVVNNGYLSSAPSTVTITANIGAVPVANAGANQNGTAGVLVTLSGAASTDGDGDTLTYAWSFVSRPVGSGASLSGATTVSPTFTPDQSGSYVIQLIVNDGISNSAVSTVTITVVNRGNIVLPATIALGLGTQVGLPITLSTPAPAGGVTVSLSSSNPSILSLTPASVFIAAGATSPAASPLMLGSDLGTVTISSAAIGYTPATQSARVTATIGFTPQSLTFIDTGTKSLTLTLSGPAPASGITLNLSSTNPAVATVPATSYIAPNATTATVVVTGVAPGSATIRASGTELAETTASVLFSPPDIGLPINLVVPPGEQVPFPITLARPSQGTTFVEVTSSDTSKATLSVQNVVINDGQTTPTFQPKINGIAVGTVQVTATAIGLNSAHVNVRVGIGMNFAAPTLAVTGTATESILLSLSGPAPQNGVEVTLVSSNPAVATVPSTVVFAATTSAVNVPVTGVSSGTATITATSATAGVATLTVTVGGGANTGSIILPVIAPVTQGQTVSFPITLSSAAATGGVTINLQSSAPSVLTIAPSSVNIPAGQTQPSVQPQVTGGGGGTANVTASATGYTQVSQSVQVNASSVPSQVLAFSGTPQSATTATAFANPLIAVVRDSSGNPLSGVLVTFAAPASGASGTFAGGVTTATTNGSGLAASGVFTANSTAGAYTVTASVSGVVTPASFTLTNTAPSGGSGGGANAITISPVTVGQNLQTLVNVTLPSVAPAGGKQVTVTSGDPNLALVSGRATGAGSAQVTFFVLEGLSTAGIYVHGLSNGGTVTLTATASGLSNGTGTVTLAPSGFVLTGPNGPSNQTVTMGQGSSAALTVSAARLDSALKFVESQAIRGGFSVNVPLLNSAGVVGSVSPSPVTLGESVSSASATFTANGPSIGNTNVSAGVPSGFSQPALGADTVAVSVISATIITSPVTVGENLQTTTNIRLNSPAQSDMTVTVTSSDPAKLLFSKTIGGAGSTSIDVLIPTGRTASTDFYVQGLGNTGTVSFSASANNFGSVNGTVTLTRSGFTLSGPAGTGGNFNTTSGASNIPLTVFAARLDANLNAIESQQVRGGFTVDVTVTSATPATGTIVGSPVHFTGGLQSVGAEFDPASAGTSVLGAAAPAGFSTPASGSTLTVTVTVPGMAIENNATIGNNLQAPGTVLIGQVAPQGGLVVTLTSNSPDLLLSATETGAGSSSITVTLAEGTVSKSYYMQGRASSGAPTYTATAPGFQTRTATVNLAPSGIIVTGPFGIGFPFPLTVSGGVKPATITTALLDPSNNSYVQGQALAGGLSLTIPLSNSNPSAATIPAQVTFTGGTSLVDVPVQPVAAGSTLISLPSPLPGFSLPRSATSLAVSVTN